MKNVIHVGCQNGPKWLWQRQITCIHMLIMPKLPKMTVTEIGSRVLICWEYQNGPLCFSYPDWAILAFLHRPGHEQAKNAKMAQFKKGKSNGLFWYSQQINKRDRSLSQSVWAILVFLTYQYMWPISVTVFLGHFWRKTHCFAISGESGFFCSFSGFVSLLMIRTVGLISTWANAGRFGVDVSFHAECWK